MMYIYTTNEVNRKDADKGKYLRPAYSLFDASKIVRYLLVLEQLGEISLYVDRPDPASINDEYSSIKFSNYEALDFWDQLANRMPLYEDIQAKMATALSLAREHWMGEPE